MAKYTIELQTLVNSGFDIGLKEYPIFSEEYRTQLNNKIINHFSYYEIGAETPSRFKFFLNNKMAEIMPYYNQLYKSELLVINPLLSFERKNDTSREIDNTLTSNSDIVQDTTNKITKDNTQNDLVTDKNIYSETPSALLSDNDIDNDLYATTANIRTNTSELHDTGTTDITDNVTTTNDNVTTGNTTETTTITDNGFEIPLADLLTKYRETFLNIDMQIIKELKSCFMLVF